MLATLQHNLFSVKGFTKANTNHSVEFAHDAAFLRTADRALRLQTHGNMWCLPCTFHCADCDGVHAEAHNTDQVPPACTNQFNSSADWPTWHARLGHCPLDRLKVTLSSVRDMVVTKASAQFDHSTCDACLRGKLRRHKHGDPDGGIKASLTPR